MKKLPLLDIVVGARPNFVKISLLLEHLTNNERCFDYRLIHTGQHYDRKMSDIFFEELNIPSPSINLGVGSGSQAEQTANIMIKYEKLLMKQSPSLCIVVGDVNSTMACAIVAKKQNIKLAHIEAGIRSFDMKMPEEVNRIVTDSLTDYFFTTSDTAGKNLLSIGIKPAQIFFVGNTMVDTLLKNRQHFKKPEFFDTLKLEKNHYFTLTLHRPQNVDEEKRLNNLLEVIVDNLNGSPLIFVVHPRTKKVLSRISKLAPTIFMSDPLSYLEFNFLIQNSKAVLTDSGGITEEATILGVPCLTLRENTERPETVLLGTNELVGTDPVKISDALRKIFNNSWKKGEAPEKWDGESSARIVNVLKELFG